MVYHNIILNMLNKCNYENESVEFLQLKGLCSLSHHCQSSHSPPRYSAHLSWSVDMNEYSMSTEIQNLQTVLAVKELPVAYCEIKLNYHNSS